MYDVLVSADDQKNLVQHSSDHAASVDGRYLSSAFEGFININEYIELFTMKVNERIYNLKQKSSKSFF